MHTIKNKLYIIIILTLLAAGIAACQNNQPDDASKTEATGKAVAKANDTKVAELIASLNMHYFTEPVKAPEFELDSVKGGKISLSQYRGNVVLLSFWATW